MSRVFIIAGTRGFADYNLVKQTLFSYLKEHYIDINDVEIVTGDVPGACFLGVKFAEEYRLALSKFYAMPEAYGEAADWVRNEQMAEYAEDRHGTVFAFWDGKSQGTQTMLALAKRHNLEIHTVLYRGEVLEPEQMLDAGVVFGLDGTKTGRDVVDNMNDLFDLDPSIRSF
jgi:hypothetical protein